MYRFFDQLSSRIAAPVIGESSRNSKVWPCRCGQSLFFRNSQCLACSAALGYQPAAQSFSSLQPGWQADTWLLDVDPAMRRVSPLRQSRLPGSLQLAVARQRSRCLVHRLQPESHHP